MVFFSFSPIRHLLQRKFVLSLQVPLIPSFSQNFLTLEIYFLFSRFNLLYYSNIFHLIHFLQMKRESNLSFLHIALNSHTPLLLAENILNFIVHYLFCWYFAYQETFLRHHLQENYPLSLFSSFFLEFKIEMV